MMMSIETLLLFRRSLDQHIEYPREIVSGRKAYLDHSSGFEELDFDWSAELSAQLRLGR
jgi:hypothetical protein